jgi:subtilisin family serine protease
MSTVSNTNRFDEGDYPPNTSFKICNIGGTSMASPQVCGVGALLLQANPHSTPAQLKSHLIASCQTNGIYSTGLDNDYTDTRSLKGSNNRFLVNPFSSEYKFRIQN